MAAIEELKEIIVNLRVSLAQSRIQEGNCAPAYYPDIPFDVECGTVDCDKCRRLFFAKYREYVNKEVEKW